MRTITYRDQTALQRFKRFWSSMHVTHPNGKQRECFSYPDYVLEAQIKLAEEGRLLPLMLNMQETRRKLRMKCE